MTSTSVTVQTTTVLAALEAMGFTWDQVSDLPESFQAIEVTVRPAVDALGRVFTHCGGDAILAFVPVKRTLRSLYLVHDSSDASTWEVRMRSTYGSDVAKAVRVMGPRPSARVRLVASA